MFNLMTSHQKQTLKNLFNSIENGAVENIQNNDNLHQYIHLSDESGETVLHKAAQTNHVAMVNLFLAQGASINARNNEGATPLHVAAIGGSGEVIEALLSNRAIDINAKDEEGNTPLHWAANHHDEVSFNLLVSYGADRTIVNNEGARPTFSFSTPGLG